ncbi:MAG: hypothetical protein L0215_09635 [Gemmataceae bacterium]|nr:hypothetical protein [Gemmataceae bacterium]
MLIVPGRPAVDGLTWWVMSEMGQVPVVRMLEGPDAATAQVTIRPLKEPNDPAVVDDIFLVATTGLQPDARYTLEAVANQESVQGTSRTLPSALAAGQPFTIALGSCYCRAKDRVLASVYPPPLHDNETDPIRMRFLGGDQIYMDLSATSGAPLLLEVPAPWQLYANQWQQRPGSSADGFGAFLGSTPSLVAADDHEFWNDYPHENIHLTRIHGNTMRTLATQMDRAFSVFQASLNIDPSKLADTSKTLSDSLADGARTFQMDVGPLHFFVLDVRTRRTRFNAAPAHFAQAAWLDRFEQWLGGLAGPGILVVAQPLVEDPVKPIARFFHTMGDVNLPDYPEDFGRLWDAICSAPHDVLILSGDIHWSRLYSITPAGKTRPQIFEVISSPLARIPGSGSFNNSAQGKVKWNGSPGLAEWTKWFAKDLNPTYATLTFVPQVDQLGGSISVSIRWWEPSGNSTLPQAMDEKTFLLS